MRLSPILATAISIAAPLGFILPGVAQNIPTEKKIGVISSVNPQDSVKQDSPAALLDLQPGNFSENLGTSGAQVLGKVIMPTVTVESLAQVERSPRQIPKKPLPQKPVLQKPVTPKPVTPKPVTPKPIPLPNPTVPDIPPPGNQIPIPSPGENQPIPQPPLTPPDSQPDSQPTTNPEAAEPRVLVSEVSVKAENGQLSPELEQEVYKAIRTQPGRTTTRSQLQEDINAIFATGFFANVQAFPEDTPLGVRVSFTVQPNPVLTKVEIQANGDTGVPSVLSPEVAQKIFTPQYGKILNLKDLQEGIKKLTGEYQKQGYVLANIVGVPQVTENGIVTLQVVEGVVESVQVRFRNKDGETTDAAGKPLQGRTKSYIVTREVELKPNQVFNRNTVQRDLQRVFSLGLFEDINVSLDPGNDPSKVNVVMNVVERNSGSIAAGAGISSASGLFGSASYQEQNLGGRNQKLGAEAQIGQRDLLFNLSFTDPWIAGDKYRTSFTTNIFRRQSISLIFDGPKSDIETFNPGDINSDGDRPRVVRLGGGVTFSRPLSPNPYKPSEWNASLGLQYQRISIQDRDGKIRKEGRLDSDNLGNIDCATTPSNCLDLSQSGTGEDDLLLFQLGASRDRRNNPLQPTSGSFLRLGVDQSVPVGNGSISLTRFRGSYSQYFPVKITSFTKGPETLAFNFQGGTILGDVPPYEAFSLGGSNSVRGYDEGTLGSGRSYLQATAEYRFPVFSLISGALFVDYGTDLGTGTRAADLLNKNGSGFGYGVGVRVQSPLGPIRIDYGFNDDGDSRINFGIGERF
jgi:outer membrane protein insertion porin family